jgi:hypothetical protein
VTRGVLLVTLSRFAGRIFVSIGGPKLSVSRSLAAGIRHGRVRRGRMRLEAIDSRHHFTRLYISLRLQT